MISLIKKVMQKLNGGQAQYERLLASAENETLAMCCSSVNPQLLAQIKRSKVDNKR